MAIHHKRNPSHTYNAPGNYTVTLVVTNANGCNDTLVMPDYIKSSPRPWLIIYRRHFATANLDIFFFGYFRWSCNWLWVGPGWCNTSILPTPTHTYPVGTYNIRLVITTAGGCTDTAYEQPGIIASIKPSPISRPPPGCLYFRISSLQIWQAEQPPTGYGFFGDGGTSTQQNPVYAYQDTGFLMLRLLCAMRVAATVSNSPTTFILIRLLRTFTISSDCNNKLNRQFTDRSFCWCRWMALGFWRWWNFHPQNRLMLMQVRALQCIAMGEK